MPDFSIIGGSETKCETYGTTGQSIGTAVTSGATNTKGAWVEIIASSGIDIDLLYPAVRKVTASRFFYDIGIGSAGNEVVVVSNMSAAWSDTTVRGAGNVQLPLHIPKGTRISVRCQSNLSANVMLISLTGVSTGFGVVGLDKIVDYGLNTGTTRGTASTGGAANVKGAYAQITASTNEDLKTLMIAPGSAGDSTLSDEGVLFDIAIGAGGSEQIILPDILFYMSITSDMITPFAYTIPVQIPAGSRIAVRHQSFFGSKTLDMHLYGGV